ncbi:MAG: septation protein SepH, partial [Acidimicrobiales bacterium]
MKKLHLVGITKESDGLVFSPRKGAKTGGFVVALDDELLASIEEARRGREGDEAPIEFEAANLPARRERPNSSLSPREIQARLRSGATIAEVAMQAGVGQDWVLRFADPILAEQARVVESAQRLTFAKSRLGPSVEPLAESVQWKLSDRGVRFSDDVFAAGWSAFNLHGTRWAVQFHYTSRQRHQVAEWEVDLRERTLTARNRLASDLGHVEAGRRRPRLEPPELGQPTDAPPASP